MIVRKPEWMPFQIYRPYAIVHIIGILSRAKIWEAYVFDEPRRSMIKLIIHGTLLAYSIYKYKWMPELKA